MTDKIPFDSYQYPNFTVYANNLGAGEKVLIYIDTDGNGTWRQATDNVGNVQYLQGPDAMTGVYITSLTMAGGPVYGILKTETLVDCGVYISPSGRFY